MLCKQQAFFPELLQCQGGLLTLKHATLHQKKHQFDNMSSKNYQTINNAADWQLNRIITEDFDGWFGCLYSHVLMSDASLMDGSVANPASVLCLLSSPFTIVFSVETILYS